MFDRKYCYLMRDRWRHIDQYKGFIGRYKIDLTLSLSKFIIA